MKKKMTDAVREKIKLYIKNKMDISDIIKDYSIKGENLSNSIIKTLNRISDDMTGVNFARATIGSEDSVVDISNSNISNANFYRVKFPGRIKANYVKAHNTNFNRSYFPHVEYQYSDFTGATFCGAMFVIDGGNGKGCKFPKVVLEQLMKDWEMI